MKNNQFKVSVLCVAALTIGFVATSCSDEENSVAKAPTMGVVTIVGQDDIRPGQTVQAFAPYATGGELLTEAEYSWQYSLPEYCALRNVQKAGLFRHGIVRTFC